MNDDNLENIYNDRKPSKIKISLGYSWERIKIFLEDNFLGVFMVVGFSIFVTLLAMAEIKRNNTVAYYHHAQVVEIMNCNSNYCHIQLDNENTMLTRQPVSLGDTLIYRRCLDRGNNGKKIRCSDTDILYTSNITDMIPFEEYIIQHEKPLTFR